MTRSNFITNIIDQAKKNPKTIILPEGCDQRVLEAANTINKEKIAKIILLGGIDEINYYFDAKGYNIEGITVIDPENSERHEEYAQLLLDLRRDKGMTIEKAREFTYKSNYFATLMVKAGDADGLVSGAAHSTADTVRPALQIIKSSKPGVPVSAFFLMVNKDKPYVFSDAGLNENPDAPTLAGIAIESAKTALNFNIPANVAMLSYSTYGSASNPLVDKVQEATRIAKEMLLEEDLKDLPIALDGEMQLDAAIVPEVAAKKCPESKVAGHASVLVFPELNSGNIGYKLVQRMAGAEAFGPLLQGLNAPINDLSRGCSAEDIVGVVAITVIQSLYK